MGTPISLSCFSGRGWRADHPAWTVNLIAPRAEMRDYALGNARVDGAGLADKLRPKPLSVVPKPNFGPEWHDLHARLSRADPLASLPAAALCRRRTASRIESKLEGDRLVTAERG